jgi:hypothetical protein
VPLRKEFAGAVLKTNCSDIVSRVQGYVIEQNEALSLCDHVFYEWLTDFTENEDYYVDKNSGHRRLAEYGWNQLVIFTVVP